MALIKIVRGLILNERNEVLLVKEANNRARGFKLVTGTQESYDKDLEATFIREASEEVNYKLKNIALVNEYKTVGRYNELLHVANFFARRESGIFMPNNEISEIYMMPLNDWYNLNSMRLLNPPKKKALTELFRYAKRNL